MKEQTSIDSLSNPKLLTFEEALKKRLVLKQFGKKVVMTNGCFDLLHPGHLYFLQEAAAQGDVLWVFLNGCESVQLLKGPTRPVQDDAARAYSLAALNCVGGITIFNAPRLDAEILAFKPDVYVKAGDYTLDKLDPGERKALEAVGATIKFTPFLEGFSTSTLINKISKASESFKK